MNTIDFEPNKLNLETVIDKSIFIVYQGMICILILTNKSLVYLLVKKLNFYLGYGQKIVFHNLFICLKVIRSLNYFKNKILDTKILRMDLFYESRSCKINSILM